MTRVDFFVSVWSIVGCLTLLYLLSGAVGDFRAAVLKRRRAKVLDVLAVVLFESEIEAEAVHKRAGRLSRGALLQVIQTLAVEINGQTRSRLQKLARTRGLERHIRRRGRSRRWRLRIQAAQLQYLIEDPTFDRRVFLNDRHPLVQARAIESLTVDQAAEHVELLVGLLASQETAVRRAARQILVNIGSPVVPALLEQLSEPMVSENDAVTLEILEVAANLPDPRLLQVLTTHSKASQADRRFMAVRALSSGRGTGAEEILIKNLGDGDERVRVAALEGLARLQAFTSVVEVGRLLRDRSWAVRRGAGAALDDLGAPGALVLRCSLNDSDPFARDMARKVLDARAAKSGINTVPVVVTGTESGLGRPRVTLSESVAR